MVHLLSPIPLLFLSGNNSSPKMFATPNMVTNKTETTIEETNKAAFSDVDGPDGESKFLLLSADILLEVVLTLEIDSCLQYCSTSTPGRLTGSGS